MNEALLGLASHEALIRPRVRDAPHSCLMAQTGVITSLTADGVPLMFTGFYCIEILRAQPGMRRVWSIV